MEWPIDEDDPPIIGLPEDRSKLFRKWYTREDWGARPPKFRDPAREAVSKVYFHLNTKTPPCYGTDECFPVLRQMQAKQFNDMNDIAYNFLVTSGGNIYAGRGFGVLPTAHLRYAYGDRLDVGFIGEWTVTSGGNIYAGRGFGVLPTAHLRYAYGDRLDVGFIGEWTVETLPYNMFKSGMVILQLGLEHGYIKPDWHLEPIVPKKKIPKEEQQMQRFLNRENNRKPKKKKKNPGRRRNFGGKRHIRQWVGI